MKTKELHDILSTVECYNIGWRFGKLWPIRQIWPTAMTETIWSEELKIFIIYSFIEKVHQLLF